MASTKVTFTLDAATVARLRLTAERLGMPQSQVVREAIAEYSTRVSRLSDAERIALLAAFDRLLPTMPAREVADVDAELRALRASRRRGGRKAGT